jgi:hypothetical protein
MHSFTFNDFKPSYFKSRHHAASRRGFLSSADLSPDADKRSSKKLKEGDGERVRQYHRNKIKEALEGTGLGGGGGNDAAEETPPPLHVGLVSLPFAGHFAPLVAMSEHLTLAGHRVSLYSSDEATKYLPNLALKDQAIRECRVGIKRGGGEP